MIKLIAWLFRSRYVEHLEAECSQLKADNAMLREWHAQITSSLLVGMNMPSIQVKKPEAVPTKPRYVVPSLYKSMREKLDSMHQAQQTKEKN